jgi:TonB family protein
MRSLLVMVLLFVVSSCSAQSTQQELEGQLLHKPLFLRGLWKKDKLHFSADGVLDGSSESTGPLLSAVEIKKVELKPKGLRLSGERLALVYKDQQPHLMDLKEGMRIDVDAPAGGDYTAALASVFTGSMADLAPGAPEYWRNFLESNPEHLAGHDAKKNGEGEVDPSRAASERILKAGGSVTPPRVTFAPEPEFSTDARRSRISGSVLVYLQVGKDGMPYHIRILRPIGLGLDEKAAEAVAKYRFKPAMENGEPVPVELNVEVNFQIF